MKNYPRILSRVYGEPWAISHDGHQAIRDLLLAKLSGEDMHVTAAAGPQERREPLAIAGATLVEGTEFEGLCLLTPQIAFIPVFGIIGKHLSNLETYCGGVDLDAVCLRLYQAAGHPGVRRIIMGFGTPGGTTTGLPETAKMMRDVGATKPIDAYTETRCLSAGYYLASQAQRIVCTPSSMTGSIGTILAWVSHTERMKKEGDAAVIFQGGSLKSAGADGKEMSKAEADFFQGIVDHAYNDFRSAVTSQRPQVQDETMQGQFFYADDAQARGLVDEQVWQFGDLVAQIESELSQP